MKSHYHKLDFPPLSCMASYIYIHAHCKHTLTANLSHTHMLRSPAANIRDSLTNNIPQHQFSLKKLST